MLPLLEEPRFGDYEAIMRTPFVRILEFQRAAQSYHQLKNYDSWLEYVKNADDKNGAKAKEKQPFKWSTWEIKSAMEYDMFYVPTLGNEGWAQQMTKQGVMACNRR